MGLLGCVTKDVSFSHKREDVVSFSAVGGVMGASGGLVGG